MSTFMDASGVVHDIPAIVAPSPADALVAKAIAARERAENVESEASPSRWEEADAYAELGDLGWTQHDIAGRCGTNQSTVSRFVSCVKRYAVPHNRPTFWIAYQDVTGQGGKPKQRGEWEAANEDEAILRELGIKVQPYDVWTFPTCHDDMGDDHPGRIPGQIVCHALYFFTAPGDLVVDPMAGSGTTLDACRIMGRRCHGYDIDHRHGRADVEQHDLSTGWPETVAKAALIFWDPPYYDKMDHGTIGTDGYIEGSISGLNPESYLDWFTKRFEELRSVVRPATRLAFLMSDWDPENAKRHSDYRGIYLWDYADRLRDSGWKMRRQIHVPLPTQQVHPDIVNKFRESRRLARLERYLLVAEA